MTDQEREAEVQAFWRWWDTTPALWDKGEGSEIGLASWLARAEWKEKHDAGA